MEGSFGRHKRSPAELKAELEAERRGVPFLVWREPAGEQRLLELEPGRLTVGRDLGCDVCLADDEEVSRLHAELERVGSHWVLADHGLSRNGSFVNGERLLGERPLRDGDVLRFGTTQLRYRSPADAQGRSTRPAAGTPVAETLTPTQQRVLVALCRPYRDGSPFATPASNQQIADEVSLSVARVKAHMHDLFEKLGVGDLPHNQKRARLVELAFQIGAVRPREL
jgi:FHA domain